MGDYEGDDFDDQYGAAPDYNPFPESVEPGKETEEGEEEEENEGEILTPQVETKHRVYGNDRITWNVMTRFEFARLVGTLANMYSRGTPVDPRVKVDSVDYLIIAAAAINYFAIWRQSNDPEPYEVPIELYRPHGSDEEVWQLGELLLPVEVETYALDGINGELPANGDLPPLRRVPAPRITAVPVLPTGKSPFLRPLPTAASVPALSSIPSLPGVSAVSGSPAFDEESSELPVPD